MIQKIVFLLGLLLFGCVSENKNEISFPNPDLIKGYDVKQDKILYQYYEKYGFTDVCVNMRAYFKIESWSNKGWHKLPMNAIDIKKVNSIPDKLDTLKGDTFSIIYKYKNFFSDISLKSMEYISNSTFDHTGNLREGYYRITKNTFEVYNSHRKTIYYEFHSCN